MSATNAWDNDRWYCTKCQRWFPNDLIKNGMHVVLALHSKETHHVVLPEQEANALLREKGGDRSDERVSKQH